MPGTLGMPAAPHAPDYFGDLNLDQLVAAITKGRSDEELPRFFWMPLHDLSDVTYRQDVMRDMQQTLVMESIESFTGRMHLVRNYQELAERYDYKYERERWFLNAVVLYCDAVERLADELRPLSLTSNGLAAFRGYLAAYAASSPFVALAADARGLTRDLAAVRYNLLIKDGSITVMANAGEEDYAAVVERTFEKFRRAPVKDYQVKFVDPGRLNHVDAQILERVARLHPAVFQRLEAFPAGHAGYRDAIVERFVHEVQFYVAYLRFIEPLEHAGLPFCYPALSNISKEIVVHDAFDLALAAARGNQPGTIVRNDVTLHGVERIIVVSGPNHGGKTTFARMFGQLHYLAALGCPVPATEARLFLFDQLFTHFERAEDITTLRGKLQDDLVRIHRVLERATPNSIVIMNEAFASTTVKDALFLSERVLTALSQLDLLAVCVTFLDELASFNEKTVSMVGGVDPHDPAIRTFRLERRPADGLAYAAAIAEKYRVTYDWLRRRIGP